MQTIRWGIIGCGDVTEVKSGPGFQKATGSALSAVMRRNGALAEDYARRHEVPRWTDDAERLIADPAVDAVYIATPPGAHEALALRVLAAKKPAYIEKPMARNEAECERMTRAFADAGVPLFVAYYRRALPRFLLARELVQAGRLGAVVGVNYRFGAPHQRDLPVPRTDGTSTQALPWRLQAEHSGGGLFLDLGCHTLDVLDFVLGPLLEVQGSASNVASAYDVEDSVALSFRLAHGALGTASWHFASDQRADRIVISGERAELCFSTFGNEPLELRAGDQLEHFERPNPPHIQQPMIQTIVDELRGLGTCASTGSSGTRTQAVMDRVLASYYGTRADGFWKNPATWPGRRTSSRRASA